MPGGRDNRPGAIDMTLRTATFRCRACGKTISYAQTIFYSNGTYCLDSILDALADGEQEGDAMRVNVSADLLQRLRDGVV